MQRFARFAIALSTVALLALLVNCGGSSSSAPPPLPITVSVAPAASIVAARATQILTATLQNDTAKAGVTWTLAPASGAGVLTNATSTSVTYKAPANPPASDVTVTITATSVTDTTRTAAAAITFPAIAVAVDPASATVDAGTTQTLTATVQYDPTNKGVTWTISPASGAGTLSNATSSSVTYSAPAIPPASDVNVTITATSLTDSGRSAAATIVFPAPVIVVDPSSATLDAGSTQSFTASVQHQPGALGVTWALSPSSGAGTLSNISSTSVTYNAPASPPPSDLTATLTATSIVPAGLSASTAITVKAITVSVAPASALIPTNAQQVFTSTVQHDPVNHGVTWVLTQAGGACAPACGTLAPADATSTGYVAPAAMPKPSAVTLTATSVTDPTKAASATISVSSDTVKLVPYALDFGGVKAQFGRSKQLTTTLTNVRGAALSIEGITITGANANKFTQSNNCGSSVAAGTSCDIKVTFKPAALGLFNALLTIADSGISSPQQVILQGRGCQQNDRACLHGTALSSAVAATVSPRAPTPTGAHRAGTRIMHLTDHARPDPFLRDGSHRELMVRFWYPAATGAACTLAPYTSPEVWNYFAVLTSTPLPVVATNSCFDAPVADGAYPIVVFSHGLTATFTDYTFLFEDLASRGYIVASVDHTYEATAVALGDGRMAKSVYGSYLTRIVRLDQAAMSQAASARLGDLRFVIDELQRLNTQPDSPFAAHLDIAAIATVGHSFGGLTALQALNTDARVRAAITLEGVVPDATFTATDRPVLILDAGREEWAADERGLWDKLRGPRLAVMLRGAEHLTLSDAVWLARGTVKTGSMSPETTVAAIRNYVAAYLDAHLQGRPADRLLQRPSPEYPDAQLTLQHQVP